ncbi:MAG: GNAT family N-acetyltransferase [Thermoflexales bacterium]|nr:GNAT family N-acetyltransferase [Thermoflexales bacterium]
MTTAVLRRVEQGLVPFHPLRHLGPVADLMTEAFAGELGPWARQTLHRMRRIARWGALGFLLWGIDLDQESPGFVWVEDGRVVGNISFRRAATAGGWMIGNVAVHPQWRGRAIGRALVEAALEDIAARGGVWVGLEVREDNPAARRLYEGLGFETVGASLEMARPAGQPWPDAPSLPLPLRRARAAESHDLYYLAREGLTRTHQEVLEIRPSAYRAGWEARLSAWLEGRNEDWWVLREESGASLSSALRLTSYRSGRWHEVEVLVRPERMEGLGGPLVTAALALLARRPAWETVTALPGVRMRLEPLFADAGFRPLRRLLQMRRMLGTPVQIQPRRHEDPKE